MFALTTSNQFLLYSEPTDMRKSFDGLCGIISLHFEMQPTNGKVFVFINRQRNKVKLLHWMGSGFVLYYKRLEEGTFELPNYALQDASIRLSYSQLVLLIDGISITNIIRKKPRFASTEVCV
jgi:transposase